MLSLVQIRRLLKHCERIDIAYGDEVPDDLKKEWAINIGWQQALRLVLEKDTVPISDKPLEDEDGTK